MNHTNPDVLFPDDKRYPEAFRQLFGHLLPPELWFKGNLRLLSESAVGFCGSRKATETGLRVAADCARQLSKHSVVTVSGYAPGVDMASHEATLASGGSTIIVLPEGLDRFRIKKSIKEFWDWERVLVVSHFPRNAVWRVDRAMERNKLIVALSRAVIVLEAGERGGTVNAGFCALRMKKPVFVAKYGDMNGGRAGSEQLLAQGALPLLRNRATGNAELRRIFDVLGKPREHPSQAAINAH